MFAEFSFPTVMYGMATFFSYEVLSAARWALGAITCLARNSITLHLCEFRRPARFPRRSDADMMRSNGSEREAG